MDFFNKFKKETVKKLVKILKDKVVSVEISEVGGFQIIVVVDIEKSYFLHIVCEHLNGTNFIEFIIRKNKKDVFYERFIPYSDGFFLDKIYETDDRNIVEFLKEDLPIIVDICSGKDITVSDIIIRRI